MAKTLKMITLHGVEYVAVDEDSPLLPKNWNKRPPNEASHYHLKAMSVCIAIIFVIVASTALLGSLVPFPERMSSIEVDTEEGESIQEALRDAPRCHGFPCFERARVHVPEGLANFPSFWNYAEQGPIQVTYDERAIMLNGERSLFLSGSLHPVRATRETWESALDDAVRQGLNMVTVYVFWAAHQPFPGAPLNWSFPGNWDLAAAIRAAANRGLFVHIRIGPYDCAEYNYGGIPEWVPFGRPDMEMRRLNQEWMDVMEEFVIELVSYLTEHGLWAHQGGPIVMGQIENELGGEDDDVADDQRRLKATVQDYADWCGALATRVVPKVVWTMCNGLTAPNAINTCNGNKGCSTTWIESNGQTGRIQVDQPALWTEDEQGFQIWGETPKNPSDYFWGRAARDMARDGLLWFARGGSHLNYYMCWGGYNRGRAAASGIMNMYANDACLCASGQLRQPKYGHFKDFHEAMISVAPILLSSESALGKAQYIEHLNTDGKWKVGDLQRMFIYRQNGSDDETEASQRKVVMFVENDSQVPVTIRIPSARSTGQNQTLKMNALSAAIVVDGTLLFDSSSIDPRHKSYRRQNFPNAAMLLDWTTWEAPIGAPANDKRTVFASHPIEQTELMVTSRTSSDYAWYETGIKLGVDVEDVTVRIDTQKANALLVFIDRQFVGAVDNHEHSEGAITMLVHAGTLRAGKHKLSILSESLGYFNLIGRWGADTKAKTKGLTGDVVISGRVKGNPGGNFTQNLVDGRKWRSYPGLHGEHGDEVFPFVRDGRPSHKHSVSSPCTWTSVRFDTPNYDPTIQALFLDITSGRGRLWLNGFDLGRFWNITRGDTDEYSQRYYFLPNEYLFTNGMLNELVMFKALDGDNSATDLVLSWLEADENSSMEDEVDFPGACI